MEILLVVGGIGLAVYVYVLFMRGFREGQETARRKFEETRKRNP